MELEKSRFVHDYSGVVKGENVASKWFIDEQIVFSLNFHLSMRTCYKVSSSKYILLDWFRIYITFICDILYLISFDLVH